MKKSNIILLIILVFILVIILLLQLRIKHFFTNIHEIPLNFKQFEHLRVESGWDVELHADTLTKVIVYDDSLKRLISVQDNKLILKETSKKVNLSIKIFNPNIQSINMHGTSDLNYYNNTIDSLQLALYDMSSIRIRSKIYSKEEPDSVKIKGNVNYIYVNSFGSSSLSIHNHIEALEGELNDTTYCQLSGKVNITNLKKSENSRINSW